MLSKILLSIAISFWLLIFYYSLLTVCGLMFRVKKEDTAKVSLGEYPSVDIFVPAHNEDKVLFETLDAMANLTYPGQLKIYVLNDNSTDQTGEIADYFARVYKNIFHIKVPPGFPKGKARVLNYALSISEGDMVVVFDADNQPQPDAVFKLVSKTLENEKYAGAVGYVRTINMYKNFLTRMIGIEFLAFQLLMQCGRWQIFKLGSLTGTNMLVKRKILEELGGWDPYALAEDAELTMRITARGLLLPVVPDSVTWEQEPETFKIWLRQRTRWMLGNLYIVSKLIKDKDLRKNANIINAVQLISVYHLFVAMVLISDIWFVLGILGYISTNYKVPLLIIWFESWWVYVVQLMASIVIDREVNIGNIIVSMLMYFTYAQLWIILLIRAHLTNFKNRLQKRDSGSFIVWDKTVRF